MKRKEIKIYDSLKEELVAIFFNEIYAINFTEKIKEKRKVTLKESIYYLEEWLS